MTDKKEAIHSKIIINVIVTVVSGLIITGIYWFFTPKPLSKEEIKEKAFATLKNYADDLNNNAFDAYKYFAPNVQRFFQMMSVTPKEINDNVKNNYYKEFKNGKMWFDEKTLLIKETKEGEYTIDIINYASFYKIKEQKQYDNLRTRTEFKFDSDFRIKYLRQYYD